MDGQNFQNGQNTETQSTSQYSNYQDNTANTYYQSTPVVESVSGNKVNGMQIGSLICGIFSILLCCCYGVPSIIAGIIGIILSVVGGKQGKHGVGTAGLVCSIIGLVLGIIYLILLAIGVAAGGMESYLNGYY